jgi:uncharacterized membrane protein
MSETVEVFRAPQPRIRRVPVDRPWAWLAAGWRDVVTAPICSLAIGAAAVLTGWLMIALLLWLNLPYLVLPLSAGFFFVGPFLAVGLYEISRRLEIGLLVDAESTLLAWRRNPDQIALMGALLLLVHLAWMRTAQLLFAVFGWQTVPSWDRFFDFAWYPVRSLPFFALGVAFGAGLAAVAFAIGAFSMPYLLDRRGANLFEAIATSVAAVRLNWRPMILWACLIVVFVVLAMVPGLLGLVVVLPVVAHASWHAYRDIVRFDPRGTDSWSEALAGQGKHQYGIAHEQRRGDPLPDSLQPAAHEQASPRRGHEGGYRSQAEGQHGKRSILGASGACRSGQGAIEQAAGQQAEHEPQCEPRGRLVR